MQKVLIWHPFWDHYKRRETIFKPNNSVLVLFFFQFFFSVSLTHLEDIDNAKQAYEQALLLDT